MFRGINAIKIDSKGRIAIPTRYREQLMEGTSAQLVVTIDTETSCLLLYPLNEWTRIERKIESLPSFNAASRRIQRLLIGHATEVELDNNGRILLPPLLRDYAKLNEVETKGNKQVVLIGQGKKFEIWNETMWEEHRTKWLAEEADGKGELPDELKSLSL